MEPVVFINANHQRVAVIFLVIAAELSIEIVHIIDSNPLTINHVMSLPTTIGLVSGITADGFRVEMSVFIIEFSETAVLLVILIINLADLIAVLEIVGLKTVQNEVATVLVKVNFGV